MTNKRKPRPPVSNIIPKKDTPRTKLTSPLTAGAGACPGPACYGKGGTEPATTDAHIVIGTIRPGAFLGGRMSLDGEAATRAFQPLAQRFGLSVEQAASSALPLRLIAAMWTTERKPWTIESGSTEGGMFRSTDGGTTWTKLGGGLPAKVMTGRIGVSISGAD